MSTTIQTEVTEVKSFIQKHERFLLITLGLFIALFVGNKILDTMSTRDRAAATQAAQVLTQQNTINQQLAAQVAKDTADYKALVIQLTQQNAVLQTQIVQRQVVYQQQVAVDKTMPMPDLGNRWAKLASLNPSDITATTSGITVTPQGALDTVTNLEQLPVLKANLQDVTIQKGNLSTELDASDALNGQLNGQVKGLEIAAVDKDKSCKADIASVKADARKGKLKAFLYGTGVGVGVTLGFVLHAIL